MFINNKLREQELWTYLTWIIHYELKISHYFTKICQLSFYRNRILLIEENLLNYLLLVKLRLNKAHWLIFWVINSNFKVLHSDGSFSPIISSNRPQQISDSSNQSAANIRFINLLGTKIEAWKGCIIGPIQ